MARIERYVRQQPAKDRQRVRMQYLLQPKRAESILQTTEAVERWECDVKRIRAEIRQDVRRRRQDRRFTCVVTASSAEPLPLEFAHPEKLRTSQDDAIRLLSSTSGYGR